LTNNNLIDIIQGVYPDIDVNSIKHGIIPDKVDVNQFDEVTAD